MNKNMNKNMNKREKIRAGQLSPLEMDILEILWNKGQVRVRDIYDILKKKKKVAHTSVAVLLDRLHEKKHVCRKVETCRGGFRYIYSPSSGKEDFHKAVVRRAVDSLIERFGNAAISYFNERCSSGRKNRAKKMVVNNVS